ncbi:MAG: helix-turn-helix domain-containing protein, partial [Planktothrix agardhii]
HQAVQVRLYPTALQKALLAQTLITDFSRIKRISPITSLTSY